MPEVTKELIALTFGIGVFFSVLYIAASLHASNAKNIKSGNTWLFDNWKIQLYNALFGDKDEYVIAQSIGMDVAKYKHNCKLIRQEDKTKHVIIDKICGFVIIGIGFIVGLITLNYIIIFLGLLLAFPLVALPIHFVETAAEKRKFIVASELPRFLDLLHTALLIGMPVEQAIEITAINLRDTVLADELLTTLADTKVGAYSWQEALEKLASTYGVDSLSDFVLDITNAYNLGASILDSVARKSRDIKQTNLIAMKERASKLTSTILLPIMLFKMLPLLAIMCIPIFLQLQNFGV